MFERLGLSAIPGAPGEPEWGFLGRRSVELGDTAELQWVPKDCKKVKDTTCRIVDSKHFGIYLQSHLLPSSPLSMAKSSSVESPSSQILIPDLPTSPDSRKPATVDNIPVQTEFLDTTDTAVSKEDTDHVPHIIPIGSFDGLPETISETSEE